MKQVEKIWAELSAKAQEVETPQEVELSEEQKVELASIDSLIAEAKEGRKLGNKAKISINALKSQAKETADLIDNFTQGAYFNVVNSLADMKRKAKEIGLENTPEIKELEKAASMLSDMRGELGNGMASSWYKAISKL
jgi:hypothetical protein